MKLTITKDPNDYMDQMFNNELKSYNYLKTDIILYLLYGENLKWTYVREEDIFYVKRGNDYFKEFNREEWKKLLADHSISISKDKKHISIKTDEATEKKFLDLLFVLEVDYEIKKETKLNQILKGSQE